MADTKELTIKRVPIDSIHLDPANVRLHDERSLASIKGSLGRFGQQKPIVVDRAGTIRAGNGTYTAAKSLGWAEIQVVESDLEGIEAVAYAIADNRTSDLSTFEDEALAKLLVELREQEALPGTGFEEGDLDRLLMELGQEPIDIAQDEVPLPPDDPVSRRGDLWILGRHRLLCGDSASAGRVRRRPQDAGRFTQPRVPQIMGLLLTPPEVQERVLRGDPDLRLRSAAREAKWATQEQADGVDSRKTKEGSPSAV